MIKSDDCVLIMGSRGCGKSYLCKNLQNTWPRKIIIDTLHEYDQTQGELVYSFHEYSQKLLEYKSINKNEFTLIYQFDIEQDVSETVFNQILRIAYYYGNVLVVIEEVQTFSSPHSLPHWLKNSLLTGRHQNMALMFTTQRPGELNKTILSQCVHIFCGKIIEGNDLRYISSFLRQSSEKLINIPDRQFIYFSRDGIKQVSNDFNNTSS